MVASTGFKVPPPLLVRDGVLVFAGPPPASSAPEPTLIVTLTPLTEPAADPPMFGFPVKLPGMNEEIPRLPVM
jgi:hypothetical protein